MNATENLWPEFELDISERSLKTILNEQAEFFNQKTKGILKADVRSSGLNYSFEIVAPSLNGYRYILFNLNKLNMIGFECRLISQTLKLNVVIENESDLILKLKEIFNSDGTLKVIRSLIAQSNENN